MSLGGWSIGPSLLYVAFAGLLYWLFFRIQGDGARERTLLVPGEAQPVEA